MMFGDQILHARGQAVLACQRKPVASVLDDQPGAGFGIQAVVGIGFGGLVLDEEFRLDRFAGVVVQRADPQEQRIGADALAGVFGEVGHL
jgi:hypothetical protein